MLYLCFVVGLRAESDKLIINESNFAFFVKNEDNLNAWSDIEVELIVADYFQMLSKELASQPYSKTEHRKALLPLLNNRSSGSIEFKHQNISAVLIRLGQPYIKGYLPRYNIQAVLMDKVISYLERNKSIEKQFELFVSNPLIESPKDVNFEKWLVAPPISQDAEQGNNFKEPNSSYSRNPIKINYLEREQLNRSLGELGEQVVLEYEQWQLRKMGKEQLAKQVQWISQDDDGAGYDILSRNLDGTYKFIEVKTTRLGKETPFFFSKGELVFSQRNTENYHLFRVFNFDSNAKIFTMNGGLDTICQSEPVNYQGWF